MKRSLKLSDAPGGFKLISKKNIWSVSCLAVLIAIAGCRDENKTAQIMPTAPPVRPSESPAAESLRHVYMQGRSQGGQFSSFRDGLSAMEIAIKGCKDYLAMFPTGKDRSQVDALYGEAKSWLDHYSKLVDIKDAIETKQFDHAKRLLSAAKESLPVGDVKRMDELISTSEASENDGWIPWTLDAENYSRGECVISKLARDLDGARKWAKESEGWIQVQSIREGLGKVVIIYYDGLLKSNSVRTFYKDMATCKADRGE